MTRPTDVRAEFRSIETVDPTTLAVSPDRVVLSGSGRAEPRVAAIGDIERVRVRTLLGISTILIRLVSGPTLVADLFDRAQAEAARSLLEELRSAPAFEAGEPAAPEAVPAA